MTTSDMQHFSTEGAATPSSPGRYVQLSAIESVEFVDGLRFQPVLGEQSLVNFVSFEPHTEAPRHVHVEEQIVIVLDGEFEFDLDGDVRTMRRGDVAVIPPWVPHGAWTKETHCLEFDVFTPPRQTLLEHARRQRQQGGGGAPPGGGGEGT